MTSRLQAVGNAINNVKTETGTDVRQIQHQGLSHQTLVIATYLNLTKTGTPMGQSLEKGHPGCHAKKIAAAI